MINLKGLMRDKMVLFFIGIIIVGLIVRLFVFGVVTAGHSQDDYWFISIAENFIKTFKIELLPGQPYDLSQPLHPMLMGLTSLIFHDLYFNGKIFSLVMGFLSLPAVYFFWRKMEGVNVALLATFFVAFSALCLKFSVAVREDSLYMLLLVLSLFFIYKMNESPRKMVLAAIFISLSALTRWEGYLLIPVALFSYVYSNKKRIFKKNEMDLGIFFNKYFLLAIIIVAVPLLFWSIRSYNLCDCGVLGLVPSYEYQKQLSGGGGGTGISFVTGLVDVIPWYFLIFMVGGLLLSLGDYRKYLPIYLYIALSFLIHMAFRGKPEQIVYIYPLLAGFMGICILKFKELFSKKNMKFFYILIVAFLVLFFVVEVNMGYSKTKSWGIRNEVIVDAVKWFDENVDHSEKLLVGDVVVYSYFTDRELIGASYAGSWMYSYETTNKGLSDPIVPFVAFLFSNKINYAIAYDSTMSWFYDRTATFAKGLSEKNYNFENGEIKLLPFKKFEKNGEEIIIYKLEVIQNK